MRGIQARVVNGRLVVDEPTLLPEGTVLDLVIDDEGDNLSDEERAALHDALERSWQAAKRGEVVPADEVIKKLRGS